VSKNSRAIADTDSVKLCTVLRPTCIKQITPLADK